MNWKTFELTDNENCCPHQAPKIAPSEAALKDLMWGEVDAKRVARERGDRGHSKPHTSANEQRIGMSVLVAAAHRQMEILEQQLTEQIIEKVRGMSGITLAENHPLIRVGVANGMRELLTPASEQKNGTITQSHLQATLKRQELVHELNQHSKPLPQGTTAELAKKYGVTLSEIRRRKANETLHELFDQHDAK